MDLATKHSAIRSSLAHHVREHGDLPPPAGLDIAQLHIEHLALLGAEEGGGAHRGAQLWGHHDPALPSRLHSLDAQLKPCMHRVAPVSLVEIPHTLGTVTLRRATAATPDATGQPATNCPSQGILLRSCFSESNAAPDRASHQSAMDQANRQLPGMAGGCGTWYQAIDAEPCGCWAPLLVGAVYAVAILIVCGVVKGHLLPILRVRP